MQRCEPRDHVAVGGGILGRLDMSIGETARRPGWLEHSELDGWRQEAESSGRWS